MNNLPRKINPIRPKCEEVRRSSNNFIVLPELLLRGFRRAAFLSPQRASVSPRPAAPHSLTRVGHSFRTRATHAHVALGRQHVLEDRRLATTLNARLGHRHAAGLCPATL
eukprot:GHVU01004747.1.p1 GENE.GHVU01004747.1~~GHVU01004747.1.p1  ORF type:complete len:110 (-),score=0.98 GHVU01004747.1:46-375(-)